MKALALAPLLILAACSSAAAPPAPSRDVEQNYISPAPLAVKASPKPAATVKPAIVAKATPKPVSKPKAVAIVKPKPVATTKPKLPAPTVAPTDEPVVEPTPPAFTVDASCTKITVDAGVPAWILIYASPQGVVEPTADQEHVIDTMAPTGVQSIALPGDGAYDYGISITYFDTVEDATGTTSCP